MTKLLPLALGRAKPFLRSWLQYRAAHYDFVGLSIAVMVKGKSFLKEAYGVASLVDRQAMTTNHVFHMASQTKMVTAAVVMRLIEQNNLHLDQKVCDVLPWLREHSDVRVQTVTVRHLLTHTSGLLRDGDKAGYWLDEESYPTSRQLKAKLLHTRLVFDPGTGVKYSNIGYGLLGLLIESVTKKPYRDIVEELLGEMAVEAIVDYEPRLQSLSPAGYGAPFHHVRTPFEGKQPTNSLAPAVGMYGTPSHMCQLVHALFSDKSGTLTKESIAAMSAVQAEVKQGHDQGESFGFGLECHYVHNRRVIGHTGHASGHMSATLYDAVTGVAVSVAANARDTLVASAARGILGAMNYFIDTIALEDGQYSSRFSTRLLNHVSSVQIVDMYNKTIMIDPDDWEPFLWYEELRRVDARTLEIVTNGSVYNGGELLQYSFVNGDVEQVRLAGVLLYPDK